MLCVLCYKSNFPFEGHGTRDVNPVRGRNLRSFFIYLFTSSSIWIIIEIDLNHYMKKEEKSTKVQIIS